MKYLRLFESHCLYKEVSKQDYYIFDKDSFDKYGYIEMTSGEFTKIKDFVNGMDSIDPFYISDSRSFRCDRLEAWKTNREKVTIGIRIFRGSTKGWNGGNSGNQRYITIKKNHDDWYQCDFGYPEQPSRVDKYFKCDQIDGVKKFIEEWLRILI